MKQTSPLPVFASCDKEPPIMVYLGIDPGLDGALALYDSGQNVVLGAFPVPTLDIERGGNDKREVDIHRLIDDTAKLVLPYSGARVLMERVGAMPKQGATSMFSFGRTAGILEAAIVGLALPLTKVAPAVWKRALGCTKDKDKTLQRASELIPSSVLFWTPAKGERTKAQCTGIAEAALLAYYGANFFGLQTSK